MVRKMGSNSLHDESTYSSINESCMQHQHLTTWERCRSSCFTLYIAYVAPNYKTIFFSERGNCIHRYTLEPILLSTICNVVSLWLSAHSLRCEMEHWAEGKETHWPCIFFFEQGREQLVSIPHFDTMYCIWPHLSLLSTYSQYCQRITPYTLSSHICDAHFGLQHASIEFLHFESLYSFHEFHAYYGKMI